jgi:hypothetical protein
VHAEFGFRPIIATIIGNLNHLIGPEFIAQFERARVLVLKRFVVRQHLSEEIGLAAHVLLGQDTTHGPPLWEEFKDLGFEVIYLLRGISFAPVRADTLGGNLLSD